MSGFIGALMANVPEDRRLQAVECVSWFSDKPRAGDVDPKLVVQKLAIWLHQNEVTVDELHAVVQALQAETFLPGVAAYANALSQIRPQGPSEFDLEWRGSVLMVRNGVEAMVKRSDIRRARREGYQYPALALSRKIGREEAIEAGKRALLALSSRIPDVDEDHGAKVFEELRGQSC